MPYSFVWLYLIKCVFTCLIFVDSNTKKIFECFRCFWKLFCSSKTENFKNHFCPVLATQSRVSPVACHSREFACQFWWLVREWKVQSRGLHRDFRSSAHDSLASRPSSCEKHLENFSKFCLWMFWRLDLESCWRLTLVAKNTCLAKTGAIFKSFSVFPRSFCDCSLSLSTVSFPNAQCNPFQTPLLLHFFSKSSRKGMGLLFLTSYVMVCVLLSCRLGCYFCHIVFNHFTLCVLGMVDCVWCWFHLVLFCWSQCSYLCSVL